MSPPCCALEPRVFFGIKINVSGYFFTELFLNPIKNPIDTYGTQEPVSKEVAPDYNAFVPEEAEMYLAAMERDARAGRYNGRGEMRGHAALIAANAATYNSAGACAFARALRPSCNKPVSFQLQQSCIPEKPA